MNDYIIIKKEICSKENRKQLKKALLSTVIFFVCSYLSLYAFVKIAFWIWRG
jgi:hypothetical protein